ncbi:hypothetical protein MAA_11714 [Metarhizium robertsii ARSEF 23]|uniref:Integrase catalytic domain-containing protein n=1 Tax=Metarhizium robertsii (strain ARSEF 23 / ATCC MYA-3075) TaxID=655844 RepID=A0A0B2X710_METRA|nr:uncharacterized protein MAA_11714 [Metarhizium robertsii ARSEF 23]KHO10663.1 hypothetical protein MAA_11714 [Metarhizium robertsii ARSEF 23]
MTNNNASQRKVLLQTFEDWARWDEEFQTKAISLHLWGYIDPDSGLLMMERPERPLIGSCHRRIPARILDPEYLAQSGRQTRQGGQSSQTVSQSPSGEPMVMLPETTDPAHRARSLSELTGVIHIRVEDWTTGCVRARAVPCGTCGHGTQTLGQVWVQQAAARRKYQSATAALTKVPKDFAGWITTWEMATNLALVRKTGGVEDPNIWFDDLTKAVQPVLGNWTTIYAGIYKDKLEDKTLTIGEAAKDLRKEAERRNILHAGEKGSKVMKGAFGPTLAGEPGPSSPSSRGAVLTAGRFRHAGPDDFVFAGEQRVPIHGYGNVVICTQGPRGRGFIDLFDVALCENFPCNLVSLRQLQKRGYWWDNRPGFNCLRSRGNTVICYIVDRYDQFVIEDGPSGAVRSAFVSQRHQYNSWTRRKASKADARKWHLRLGHPGPQALEHLVNTSRDVRIKGPTTTECDDCAVSKIKRQIRRQPRDVGNDPAQRIAIDFHDIEVTHDGTNCVMLATDRWSGFIWDYYLFTRTFGEILDALKHLLGHLERQYQIKPRVVECDNEIMGNSVFMRNRTATLDFLRAQNIIVENSAVHTPAQNGGAEVSGSIIKTKARAMRAGAKLPQYLWVEIYRCAVYLYNRTPKYIYNWRTPYERLHTIVARRDGVITEGRKPYQAHLRVYGCKAFAMTPDALARRNKRQRLNPRAWIGYLVGYQSTNIYRVWNPKTGRVISTRDVIFNEDETFSGSLEQLKDDLLHISRNELNHLLNQAEESQTDRNTTAEEDQTGVSIPHDDWEGLRGEDEDVGAQLSWEDPALREGTANAGTEGSEVVPDQPAGAENSSGNSGSAEADREVPEGTDDQLQADADDHQPKDSDARSRPYPTPVSLPPTALLAMSVREGVCATHDEKFKHDAAKEPIEVWKTAFVAGRQATPIGILADKARDAPTATKSQRLGRSSHGVSL